MHLPPSKNSPLLRRGARTARRLGFTLIEILAVILIISILVVALVPMVTDAIEASKVTACAGNLRSIYDGLMIYRMKFDDQLPDESGVRFFAQIYSRGAIEQTKTNAERLTCPAVQRSFLTIGQLPWQEWWSDLELVDGTYSAYAGRDVRRAPIKRLSGSDVLVADDNDGGMNHETTTNVLYGDGSVQGLELAILREEGVLGPEEELVVGPLSQVEALTVLSLD